MRGVQSPSKEKERLPDGGVADQFEFPVFQDFGIWNGDSDVGSVRGCKGLRPEGSYAFLNPNPVTPTHHLDEWGFEDVQGANLFA